MITRDNHIPARNLEEIDRKMVQGFNSRQAIYADKFVKRFNDLVRHNRGNASQTTIVKDDGTYVIIGTQPNGQPGTIVVYNPDGTVNTVVV